VKVPLLRLEEIAAVFKDKNSIPTIEIRYIFFIGYPRSSLRVKMFYFKYISFAIHIPD
jgi:hypothetical protein